MQMNRTKVFFLINTYQKFICTLFNKSNIWMYDVLKNICFPLKNCFSFLQLEKQQHIFWKTNALEYLTGNKAWVVSGSNSMEMNFSFGPLKLLQCFMTKPGLKVMPFLCLDLSQYFYPYLLLSTITILTLNWLMSITISGKILMLTVPPTLQLVMS